VERVKKLSGFSGIALATIFVEGCWMIRPLLVFRLCHRSFHCSSSSLGTFAAGRNGPATALITSSGCRWIPRLPCQGCSERFLTDIRILGLVPPMWGNASLSGTRIERAYREGTGKHKPSYYFRKFFSTHQDRPTKPSWPVFQNVWSGEEFVFGTDYPFGLGQEGMQYVNTLFGW